MSNAPATHNTNRTTVAFAWERAAMVVIGTPTVATEQQYAGTVRVYGPDGQLAAEQEFDFTSTLAADAEEIVAGINADLTGSPVDDYALIGGTDTIMLTLDRGYSASVEMDAGTIDWVTTGGQSEQGATPTNAAAWASEGVRMYVEAAGVEYIRGDAAVENVDLEPRVFRKRRPHKGLPTADGGSITSRLWSSGNTTHSPGEQVPQTWLALLLGHALGGYSRGGDTTVSTVTNQYTVDVADATYCEAGQIVALEDGNGKLWPAQILSVDGSTLTLDREQPWTIVQGTKVHGSETVYPEQAALTNPQDANYSTLSILYQYGPHLWMVGGAHLALESITLDRAGQPKLAWSVLGGCGYTPNNGAPTPPTWTNTIHSTADVQAIGRGTKLFLQDFGTKTAAHTSLISIAFTVGVPVLPQDSVTEDDDGMPGRIGYRTEPAATTLQHVVALDAASETRWTAGSYHVATYYQRAGKGFGWCIHLPRAFMSESPTPAPDGTNRWSNTLQATEPDSGATEAALAKFVIALY